MFDVIFIVLRVILLGFYMFPSFIGFISKRINKSSFRIIRGGQIFFNDGFLGLFINICGAVILNFQAAPYLPMILWIVTWIVLFKTPVKKNSSTETNKVEKQIIETNNSLLEWITKIGAVLIFVGTVYPFVVISFLDKTFNLSLLELALGIDMQLKNSMMDDDEILTIPIDMSIGLLVVLGLCFVGMVIILVTKFKRDISKLLICVIFYAVVVAILLYMPSTFDSALREMTEVDFFSDFISIETGRGYTYYLILSSVIGGGCLIRFTINKIGSLRKTRKDSDNIAKDISHTLQRNPITYCKECGTQVSGKYCKECGTETKYQVEIH